jgi:hypothetical protein
MILPSPGAVSLNAEYEPNSDDSDSKHDGSAEQAAADSGGTSRRLSLAATARVRSSQVSRDLVSMGG